MSALKKQTSQRWTCQNEKTDCGRAIVATVWRTRFRQFALEVTNYPGTRTLDWKITLPGTQWWTGGDADRYEYTVSTLKDFVLRKAQDIAFQQALRKAAQTPWTDPLSAQK